MDALIMVLIMVVFVALSVLLGRGKRSSFTKTGIFLGGVGSDQSAGNHCGDGGGGDCGGGGGD